MNSTSIPAPYGIGFSPTGEGYLWLTPDAGLFSKLPERVEVFGTTLLRKTEFHTTLTSIRAAAASISGMSLSEAEERIVSVFRTHVAKHPISFESFADDFRYVRDDARKRESAIVRCRVNGLEELFAHYQKTLGVAVPIQPTHVTIYTKELNVGIGIDSVEEMEALQKVELPEVRKALGLA